MNDMLAASRHVTGLTDEERAERARLAVKNFRAMQHSLTGFARALTGNKKVRVELDSGIPRTDGERIFFRPPLGLGVPLKHDRSLCEKRDDSQQLLCEACRINEEVMAPIYHEISHIAFDSFAPTLEHHKQSLTERAIEEWGSKYAERIAERMAQVPAYMKNDYKSMASLISPYLPMLVNALEDARVNASMFRARPGVKVMMRSHVYGILNNGIEQPDGSVMMWRDQPGNAQVIAGCLVVGAGYEVEPHWFHDEVNNALMDATLRELCIKAGAARRAADVYEISFKVLARLRELGFCLSEQDPEEEEEEETDEPSDDGDRGDSDDESDPDDGADDAESEGEESEEGGDEAHAQAEEGPEGGEAPDAEPEAGAGSAGDEEVDPSDEASEGDGEAGSPMGDDDDHEAGGEGSEPGGEAESEGEVDPGEDGVGEGAPSEGSDGGDAGAERPESEDEGVAGERSDDSDGDGADEPDAVEATGRDDGSEQADSESGASEGEAAQDEQQSDERGVPDGDGSADHGDDSEAEASSLNGLGVDHDSEQEAEAEEGGVPSGDPVPSSSEDTGDGGEGAEDAERDADSEATGEGGDEDGTEAESTGGTVTSEQGRFDWTADEEGGLDDQQDASREPAEQQHGAESEAAEESSDEEDSEAFDMRGDEGKGGVKLEDYGTPEDVEGLLKLIENHEEPPKSLRHDIEAANKEIDRAIIQGMYFETPSASVWGVRIHSEGDESDDFDNAWNHQRVHDADIDDVEAGIECDLDVPESVMGKALLHTRRTFDANKASQYQPNLKSGRVNSRVLGRRAWSGDDRLFGKKRVPGKRDYFVLIGIDVSGSTVGVNLALAKRAAMAQAELCKRAGVQFAVYAHTFNDRRGLPYEHDGDLVLDIYEIKTADEPWDEQRRSRLARLGPDGGNLDGHTLEFYRKRLDEVQATDKIILYYTDGRMPASNYDEELEILQREIRTCKAKGYTLLGVGIRTDSPIKHGLDTVRVDNDENLKDVVSHLEKRLSTTR